MIEREEFQVVHDQTFITSLFIRLTIWHFSVSFFVTTVDNGDPEKCEKMLNHVSDSHYEIQHYFRQLPLQ